MAFTGNVSSMMRRKSRGTRPQRNAERRAARRVILPGFPIEPRPFTLSEIREYFSGDWVTCMMCGKSYRRLSASHLHRIHSMTEDEYRARYGLPWRRGLTSAAAHSNYSAATLKRIDEGFVLPGTSDTLRMAHIASLKQRTQPFRKEISISNISKANPHPAVHDKQKVVLEMMRRIEGGRTPKEIRGDNDMPKLAWFHANLTEEDKSRIKNVIWTMPYEYQARAQFGMSPKFLQDIRRLRPLSDARIAEQLGVTAMTVHRHRTQHAIP